MLIQLHNLSYVARGTPTVRCPHNLRGLKNAKKLISRFPAPNIHHLHTRYFIFSIFLLRFLETISFAALPLPLSPRKVIFAFYLWSPSLFLLFLVLASRCSRFFFFFLPREFTFAFYPRNNPPLNFLPSSPFTRPDDLSSANSFSLILRELFSPFFSFLLSPTIRSNLFSRVL